MKTAPLRNIADLSEELASGRLSATQLAITSSFAAQSNCSVFITVDGKQAQKNGSQTDTRIRNGSVRGPLDGIPIAVKDVIDTAGLRTTMASEHFRDHIPTANAAIVSSLMRAGANIIGKTNCHEFSYGIRGDAGAFGIVQNPHDSARIAGGSSSGSAAAVALGIVPLAVGTDTAGSIRVPAALCGVVGFKPTFGLIDTAGSFPLAPSFDTIGYFGTCVEDIQTALTSTDLLPKSAPSAALGLENLRVKTLNDLRSKVTNDLVASPFDLVSSILQCTETALPTVGGRAVDFVQLYHLVRSYEAHGVHQELLAKAPDLYHASTYRRLIAGTSVSEREVEQTQRSIAKIAKIFVAAFSDTDVLISPTVPIMAPSFEESDHYSSDQLLSLCVPWNVLGWPALTIPYQVPGTHLPQSVQLIGKPGDDHKVLQAGQAIEQLLKSENLRPGIA